MISIALIGKLDVPWQRQATGDLHFYIFTADTWIRCFF